MLEEFLLGLLHPIRLLNMLLLRNLPFLHLRVLVLYLVCLLIPIKRSFGNTMHPLVRPSQDIDITPFELASRRSDLDWGAILQFSEEK